MRAVSALRSSDCSLSIDRSRLIDGIGAALIGGSTVASCCAALRCKGFSRSHAKRIVRNAARLCDLDSAASQRSQVVADVGAALIGGSTVASCCAALRCKGFSRSHAKRIVRNAARLCDLDSAASQRSQVVADVGAALIGGSTVASCRAALRGKGFSLSHAKRIVRKAARLCDLDSAASQRSQVVADVIDLLLGGRTPGECRDVLRERGFTSKQTRTILRNANQGAAQQRATIQGAAQPGPSVGVETDDADSRHQLTFG